MNVLYNDKTDCLYIRIDDRKQDIINRRVTGDIVLDIGGNEKIVGIEILEASLRLDIGKLLPIRYDLEKKTG